MKLLTDRETDRQRNAGQDITSLAQVLNASCIRSKTVRMCADYLVELENNTLSEIKK